MTCCSTLKMRLFALLLAGIPMLARAGHVPTKAEQYNQEVTDILGKLPSAKDSADYYLMVSDALLKAKECDKADDKSNFVALNQLRLSPLRTKMIRSAMKVNSYRPDTLKRLINVYVETENCRLFNKAGIPAGKVALTVAKEAFTQGNAEMANYYSEVAMRYAAYAEKAAEVKVKCLEGRLHTAQDSTKYVNLLLELHEQCPKNRTFFSLLLRHLQLSGDHNRLMNFANDELRKDSTSVSAWVVKGEEHMNRREWVNAIAALNNALKYDSTLTAAVYNLGISHSARAIELRDSLVDERGRLKRSERPIVRKEFELAKNCFEKVRQKDPYEEKLKWRKPLYQAYYALSMRRQAKELKKEITGE